MFKRSIMGAGICLLLCFISGCDPLSDHKKSYPFEYSNGSMGTSFSIKISRLPDSFDSKKLKQQIDSLLVDINAQMSTYIPDSELSKLNNSQSIKWQAVSDPLYQVLQKAKLVYEQSHGVFDVTIGPLVNLWGFGSAPMDFVAPAPELIAVSLKKTGSEYLLLNDDTQSIKKANPDLMIDLSALAKGYAVDQVALLLDQKNIQHYMVEIGGELKLKGHNIENREWRIALEKPTIDRRMIQKVLPVSNISIATSGDYRNYFEQDGIRYSHTIDPRTGSPIKHKLASVTVLSDTCMDADAWATALMVLGSEQGYELAEQRQIAALFIIKSGDGFIEKSTTPFSRLIEVKL